MKGLRIGILVFLCVLFGCSGGGTSGKLIVGNIDGPNVILDSGEYQYKITASGDTGIKYAWIVEPSTSGQVVSQTSSTMVFKPNDTPSVVPVTIQVTVSSDNSESIVKSIPASINDSDFLVMDIHGPASIDELQSVQYSVQVVADLDMSFLWSVDPESAGDFSVADKQVATFIAADILTTISPEISVSVGISDYGTAVRTKPIVINYLMTTAPVALASADKSYGNPNEQLHFTASDSYDPDGGEVSIEWDWENDGTFDENGEIAEHSYSQRGFHEIQVRVTDNEGETSLLNNPIIVAIDNYGVATFGGPGDEIVTDVEMDPTGDIWILTNSKPDADLDPGPGVVSPTGDGGAYLSRINSDNELVHHFEIGNGSTSANLRATSKFLEISDYGNIYVAGTTTKGVDFDPGSGVLQPGQYGGTYIIRYSESGNVFWGRFIDTEATLSGNPTRLVTNSVGRIYLPEHTTSWEFDPILGTIYTYGNRYREYNANGTILNQSDYNQGAYGHYYSSFSKSRWNIDRDTGGGGEDGAPVTTRVYKENSGLKIQVPYSVGRAESDISGGLWVTAHYEIPIDIDSKQSDYVIFPVGERDSSIIRYNSQDTLMWHYPIGGVGARVYIEDLIADDSGNVYVSGRFEGTVDFDAGMEVVEHTSSAVLDTFVLSIDENGNFRWVDVYKTESTLWLSRIFLTENHMLTGVGVFYVTADFGQNGESDVHTSDGIIDMFIVRTPTSPH